MHNHFGSVISNHFKNWFIYKFICLAESSVSIVQNGKCSYCTQSNLLHDSMSKSVRL